MNTFELVVGILLVLMILAVGTCASRWGEWKRKAHYHEKMKNMWYKFYCEEGQRERVCPSCRDHFFPCDEEDAREGLGKDMP